MRKLFATGNDFTLAFARLILGCVFFAHGAQKVLGLFGGAGFSATLNMFTGYLHIPMPLAVLAIVTEFLAGLGLIVGLLSRVAALGIVSIMLVAIVKVHIHMGFFANWTGTQKGEGIEYHLLAIALAVLIMVKGTGALSFDRALSKPKA